MFVYLSKWGPFIHLYGENPNHDTLPKRFRFYHTFGTFEYLHFITFSLIIKKNPPKKMLRLERDTKGFLKSWASIISQTGTQFTNGRNSAPQLVSQGDGNPVKIGARACCRILQPGTKITRVTAGDLQTCFILDNSGVHEYTKENMNKNSVHVSKSVDHQKVTALLEQCSVDGRKKAELLVHVCSVMPGENKNTNTKTLHLWSTVEGVWWSRAASGP